jgi:iron complex outermembrane receptor protein
MGIERFRLRGFGLSMAGGAIAATLLLPPQRVLAQVTPAPETAYEFNLPGGDLAKALDAFSRQAGIQIGYAPELVADKQAGAIRGRTGWHEALGRLLQGSGLEYRQIGDGTFVLQRLNESRNTGRKHSIATSRNAAMEGGEAPVTEIESVTVTGTRIRGGSTPSPVITIGSERIREEGFADLGDVIRSVPQNFSGGQNPGVFMGNVTTGGTVNQNVTGGSALNLRGLGPDASLTLLNGRRLSYSGFSQAVDISAIPVEAVERIEIVADGASAIYGSDAVGGVGNVILKRDFDGATVGTRYGTATEGGLATREYSVTAGTTWSSGGLIATYKDGSNDPIYARQRDYADHLPEPSTIYPEGDLYSGLLSVHQNLGDVGELRLDALRTKRTQAYSYFGSPSVYSHLSSETTTTLISPSIEFWLPGDWSFTAGSTWGRDRRTLHHDMVDAPTGASTPYLYNCHCNESRSAEIGAEGPLFTLPGGDARVALGLGRRSNGYAYPDYLSGTLPIDADESVRFAYVELNLPLLDDGSGLRGSPRLEATAAVRRERYDSFGSVTTPKLGAIYRFSPDFTLKASWGRSFKAPTLLQRYNPMTSVAIAPGAFGGIGCGADDALLFLNGGDPDLKPERARMLSGSLAFHPEALPGLEAELTWFKVEYRDRVVQPDSAEPLTDPRFAEFVENSPSLARVEELVANSRSFYNYLGQPFDPSLVVVILNGRYVNATRQSIKGLDLSGSYGIDLDAGRLTIRGAASWLDSTQLTPGASYAYDLAGTLNNPAHVNGRFGAVWQRGGLAASAFANYTGGVTDTVRDVKGASFTTFDTTLGYRTGDRADLWSGLEFALAVQNVLNRPPPLYALGSLYVAPYDSANYSAVGRFVSVSVSKHW